MADKTSCLLQAKNLAGELFSDQELINIFNESAEMKQRIIDQGATDDLFERVKTAIAEKVLREKRQATAQKLRVQNDAINRVKNLDDTKARVKEGLSPKNAVLSLFHGTIKGIKEGRVSIARQLLGYEQKFTGTFMGKIAEERPHILGMLRDEQFDEAVTRELMELSQGKKTGITKNADAGWFAELANKQLMVSRITVNKFGAALQDTIGYNGPEAHNDVKIMADKDNGKAWITHMLTEALNIEASFPGLDPKQHRSQIYGILKESYKQIVTGDNNAFGTVMGARAKEPPISSQFVFKSADAAIAYQKKYGYTSTVQSVLNTLQSRAHDAAVMERFGHNPRRALGQLLADMRKEIEDAGGNIHDTAALHTDNFDTALNLATGQVNHIQHHSIAKVNGEIRSATMMALLGKAVLAAIPADTVTMAQASMFRGDGFWRGFMGAIFKSMDGLSPEERKAKAYYYGEGFDGLTGHLSRGVLAEDGRIGWLSKQTDMYFKLNGLTPWTDSRRAMSARVIAAQLGRNADRQFDDLHWRLQNVLQQNGIDRVMWEDIRSLVQTGDNGNKYIYPEGFNKLTHLNKAERDKLEMNLRGYIADEVNMGVLESDAAAKYTGLMAGAQRGTWAGEIIRNITQFTTFPLVFGQRVLGRSFIGVPGKTTAERMMRNAPHAGAMMASMLAAGYASWALKEIAKGNTPPMPTEDNFLEFGLKTFESSGVAGYYGSIILDAIFHGGRQPGLGPVGDTAFKALGMTGDVLTGDVKHASTKAYDIVLNNTPYMNLFYLRPVLDSLLLNSIDEIMHPQRAERAATQMKKFNQERIWDRSL